MAELSSLWFSCLCLLLASYWYCIFLVPYYYDLTNTVNDNQLLRIHQKTFPMRLRREASETKGFESKVRGMTGRNNKPLLHQTIL